MINSYRNNFGVTSPKESSYYNLKIDTTYLDGNIIAVNPEYLALVWLTPGTPGISVIPIENKGRCPDFIPSFRGHLGGTITDLQFNPFDDKCFASGGTDGNVLVWKLPSNYQDLYQNNEPDQEALGPLRFLKGHTSKVVQVKYHPCASGILASASNDQTIRIWDYENSKEANIFRTNGTPTSISYNADGNLLAVSTSTDKKIKIFDARSGCIELTGPSHASVKPVKLHWADEDSKYLISTGFSQFSKREIGVWDIRSFNSSEPQYKIETLDSSSTLCLSSYDRDLKLFYIGGRGDTSIHFYEFNTDRVNHLSTFKAQSQQFAWACAPKRALNTDQNEVAKLYKVTNGSGAMGTNSVESVSFYVATKTGSAQASNYPLTESHEPSITGDDWLHGVSFELKKYDLLQKKTINTSDTSSHSLLRINSRCVEKEEPPKVDQSSTDGVSQLNKDTETNSENAATKDTVPHQKTEDSLEKESNSNEPSNGSENENHSQIHSEIQHIKAEMKKLEKMFMSEFNKLQERLKQIHYK